jgi:GNAT superfamily N-acetyltransferase
MTIRKATIDDMKGVLSLIQELAIFENEPDAVVVTEEELQQEGFGNNPQFYTFIAEIENEIVGIALYYYRFSTWKGKTIHLEDLIVKDNVRGKGVGYALYSEIIKQAQKDKVRRIDWNVLDWNSSAIDFYESTGAKVLNDWRVAQMDKDAIDFFVANKLKS